jgi:osmoprotectant transport system permease protein
MTTTQGTSAKAAGGASRLLRYLVMPVFLGVVCLALYLYVSTQQLDSIERRILTANFLFARVIEHIQLAVVSTLIVVVLAVTTGILLTRPGTRRVTPFIIGLANIGQAVPSIGLLVLFAIVWDFGFWPAIVALVAYSFLSILRNTMVGLQQVDRSTIEAARGMGMTKMAVLFRIELPLAVPIILAGIRTALIINVGTATLAAFVDAGGLGTVIDRGIRLGRDSVLIVGSVLTGVLALSIDWLAGVAEDILRPKGL